MTDDLMHIRVDLKHAEPPIWRRLEVRSDLTLDVVHLILQAAFGWTDSHLHRFAVGGDPFAHDSDRFLCPFEVEEGDVDGMPAAGARIDEVLRKPGDVLNYVYDYGDCWEVEIRLESVHAIDPNFDQLPARCTDGRRAAPPENCGGMTNATDLARVIENPASFDLDEADAALRSPQIVLRARGLNSRLLELSAQLAYSGSGPALHPKIERLQAIRVDTDKAEKAAALHAYLWFLDRIGSEGLQLTAAGYLKPVDAEATSAVVPSLAGWIGKMNREPQTPPLRDFRESVQALGLARKSKGKLVLTPAGRNSNSDPETLWNHMSSRIATNPDRFTNEATLLLLLEVAAADGPTDYSHIVQCLRDLGWATDSGPIEKHDVYRLPTSSVLKNVTRDPVRYSSRHSFSAAAQSLARDALFSARANRSS